MYCTNLPLQQWLSECQLVLYAEACRILVLSLVCIITVNKRDKPSTGCLIFSDIDSIEILSESELHGSCATTRRRTYNYKVSEVYL